MDRHGGDAGRVSFRGFLDRVTTYIDHDYFLTFSVPGLGV